MVKPGLASKAREELEAELLDCVVRAEAAWLASTGEAHEQARKAFQDALRMFNDLVIHGTIPTDDGAD